MPKRTLHAGDCYEVKDDATPTSIRIKVICDYIEVPIDTTVIKVDMKRIYLQTGMVLNDYPDIQIPIIYPDKDEKYYVGNNIW